MKWLKRLKELLLPSPPTYEVKDNQVLVDGPSAGITLKGGYEVVVKGNIVFCADGKPLRIKKNA